MRACRVSDEVTVVREAVAIAGSNEYGPWISLAKCELRNVFQFLPECDLSSQTPFLQSPSTTLPTKKKMMMIRM